MSFGSASNELAFNVAKSEIKQCWIGFHNRNALFRCASWRCRTILERNFAHGMARLEEIRNPDPRGTPGK